MTDKALEIRNRSGIPDMHLKSAKDLSRWMLCFMAFMYYLLISAIIYEDKFMIIVCWVMFGFSLLFVFMTFRMVRNWKRNLKAFDRAMEDMEKTITKGII